MNWRKLFKTSISFCYTDIDDLNMLKTRRKEDYIQIYEPFRNIKYNLSKTSWEMIKLVKKYGVDGSIPKIMKLFGIDEKNAREDVKTILDNLEKLSMRIEDIPSRFSNKKYAPRTVNFDITARCNQNCIYCYATDRLDQSRELTIGQIKKLFYNLYSLDTWEIMLSGGEVFLRKDIFEILKILERYEIVVSILTNATLITKSVAKKLSTFKNIKTIRISLDSCIPENHDFNRGKKGAYKKTLEGINNLIKERIVPHIEMVVTNANKNDLEQTMSFLCKLGIKKVTIGPTLTNTGRGLINKKILLFDKDVLENLSKKLLDLKDTYKDSMYIELTREFFVYSNKKLFSKKEIKCGVGKSIIYISPDGLVYPCIFSVNSESYLGDIKKDSIKKIWGKSSLLRKYRGLDIADIEKCTKCDLKDIYNMLKE